MSWQSTFDSDPHVIYAVDQNLRIIQCNPAWDAFALGNNGSACKSSKIRGVCLFEVIPRDLSAFYDTGFKAARNQGQWQHIFDCSSARVLRRLRMTVTKLGTGFLVRNVSIKDTLAPPSAAQGRFADYGRTIMMCCHCRHVENKRTNAWDWVPEFIETSPADSRNRLCPSCYAYHYGEVNAEQANSA